MTLDPATFAYDHGVMDDRTDRALELLTFYADAWRAAIRAALDGEGEAPGSAHDPLARLRELSEPTDVETLAEEPIPADGGTFAGLARSFTAAKDRLACPHVAAALRAPLVPMTDAERAAVAEVTSDPATWQSTEEFMAKIAARRGDGGER